MSRRALSSVATIAAVRIVLGVAAWGRGSDEPAGGQARHPAASSSGIVDTPTTTGQSTRTSDGRVDHSSGLPWVDVDDLPLEAQETLDLVEAGGPFTYPGKDGSTFGNLERLLPREPRGYYAEYTVPTPGSRDRGARRIITGDGGEFYWTADHYVHFERIRR